MQAVSHSYTEPSWSHVNIIYYKFLESSPVISEELHVGETMHRLPKSAGTAILADGMVYSINFATNN